MDAVCIRFEVRQSEIIRPYTLIVRGTDVISQIAHYPSTAIANNTNDQQITVKRHDGIVWLVFVCCLCILTVLFKVQESHL